MRIGGRARFVRRGAVFGVVIVNLVGVTAGDFLNRLVFLFQLSHVAFERGLELALSAAKLSDGFSDRLAQLRQFLGAEQDKRDEENNDQFLHTDRTHGKTSAFMIASGADTRVGVFVSVRIQKEATHYPVCKTSNV